MAAPHPNNTESRRAINALKKLRTLDSALPTDELAEAIELLQQARGMLECLEAFGEPGMGISECGLSADEHVRRMANAASGAARLVKNAQAFLIEARVIEATNG